MAKGRRDALTPIRRAVRALERIYRQADRELAWIAEQQQRIEDARHTEVRVTFSVQAPNDHKETE